jgi:hypothetical protein
MNTISRSTSSFHKNDSCKSDYLDECVRVFCSCDDAQWSTIVRTVCPIDVYVQGFFARSYYLFSFFFSSLRLSLPVHFYSLFVVHVKMALELLKYIHTQRGKRKRVQASSRLFLFHFFSRNSSLVYVYLRAINAWI